MCCDVYNNQRYHDIDALFTYSNIKLYTPRTNNINKPPLLPLDDNEEYVASCFVEEDDNYMLFEGQLFGLLLVINGFADFGHLS
jgi:hypothetical protein